MWQNLIRNLLLQNYGDIWNELNLKRASKHYTNRTPFWNKYSYAYSCIHAIKLKKIFPVTTRNYIWNKQLLYFFSQLQQKEFSSIINFSLDFYPCPLLFISSSFYFSCKKYKEKNMKKFRPSIYIKKYEKIQSPLKYYSSRLYCL